MTMAVQEGQAFYGGDVRAVYWPANSVEPGTSVEPTRMRSLLLPSRSADDYGCRHMFTEEILRRHRRVEADPTRCVCGVPVAECEVATLAASYGVNP
jgi:hypothetical protein